MAAQVITHPSAPPVDLATELKTLARLVLAAYLRQQQGCLDPHVAGLLSEWAKAADYLRGHLGEADRYASYTAKVTDRALGMLLGESFAKLAMADELAAVLNGDGLSADDLRNKVADGDWDGVASTLTHYGVAAYHADLERRAQ